LYARYAPALKKIEIQATKDEKKPEKLVIQVIEKPIRAQVPLPFGKSVRVAERKSPERITSSFSLRYHPLPCGW
jgi:hypothetical protein